MALRKIFQRGEVAAVVNSASISQEVYQSSSPKAMASTLLADVVIANFFLGETSFFQFAVECLLVGSKCWIYESSAVKTRLRKLLSRKA
jgi:hypothetical protein